MMASVDTFIASIVVGVSNAQIACTLLHTSYTNKSHAHVYSLWDQLNRVTKDDKTIIEYLHQIKTISDELATAGSSIATKNSLSSFLEVQDLIIEKSPLRFTIVVSQSHIKSSLRNSLTMKFSFNMKDNVCHAQSLLPSVIRRLLHLTTITTIIVPLPPSYRIWIS